MIRPMRERESDRSLPFMPQLDSVRALAALAVVYTHYWPERYWLFGVYWGGYAVRCFFVLSGFLITSILLRDLAASPFKIAYLRFLSRRAFRLYPILLLSLASGAILGIEQIRETLPWHLAYMSNFYIVKIGAWPRGPLPNYWSLAVEEQFYLIWPLVIFLLPRRWLPAAFAALIASSLAFRLSWRAAGLGDLGAWVLPPGSFDALAMGAWLALFKGSRRFLGWIGAVGLCLWLTANCSAWFGETWFVKNGEVGTTGAAMCFVWIIARAAEGFRGVAGKIMDNPGLRYIGAISYGIYILHDFTPYYLREAGLQRLPGWLFSAIAVAATFLLASISWHFIERPIARAGRRWIAYPALAVSSAKS